MMILNIIFFLLSTTLVWSYNSGYAPAEPIVNTKYGDIRGTTDISKKGREFYSFKGIPYAKSPVGDLRFKDPEPPESWQFPLDARHEGPYCAQLNYFFYADPQLEGQEDCLYLNVYVPKLSDKLLPVMVFIHWGGFVAGRGTSDYIGPEYLMDRDVILVTFNYRLGVLGFLSTLDDEAPGNYALKDQSAALRWVKENIENFGGNSNKVTIFGQSAGAGSVHAHILSPLSKGLFHSAISQSGSSLALWIKPINDIQINVTYATASVVGCRDYLGNNTALLQCLRKVPVADLVNSIKFFKYLGPDPISVFSSVIEVKTENNPNPFFTKQPLEYIQNGEFQNVPWIVGTTKNEGILRVSSLVRQKDQRDKYNANYSALLPQMLILQASVLDVENELGNITNFYLNGNGFINISNPFSIQGVINIYTDRAFAYPSYQSVMLHSAKGHKPIWFYTFDYRGEYTYGDLFATTNATVNFDWGVCHCDDLIYLLRSPALFPDIQSPTSQVMSDILLDYWTNFATWRDPLAEQVSSVNWNPLSINSYEEMKNENLEYLSITGSAKDNVIELRPKKGFQQERMKFWSTQNMFENFDGLN